METKKQEMAQTDILPASMAPHYKGLFITALRLFAHDTCIYLLTEGANISWLKVQKSKS